jgi:hypothetical protein
MCAASRLSTSCGASGVAVGAGAKSRRVAIAEASARVPIRRGRASSGALLAITKMSSVPQGGMSLYTELSGSVRTETQTFLLSFDDDVLRTWLVTNRSRSYNQK